MYIYLYIYIYMYIHVLYIYIYICVSPLPRARLSWRRHVGQGPRPPVRRGGPRAFEPKGSSQNGLQILPVGIEL